jgi:hypothetical protein
LARKEFVRTLADNFLIVNNETGEISGTLPTTFGFNGSITEPNFPVQISQDADNGITYEIDNWFSFSTLNIRAKLLSSYSRFHELLVKAGYDDDKSFTYTFLSSNSIIRCLHHPMKPSITAEWILFPLLNFKKHCVCILYVAV